MQLFRTTKRTVRYVEADILDEEDDGDGQELNMESDRVGNKVMAPTPNKKPKVLRKQKAGTKVKDTEEPVVKEVDDLPESSRSKSSKKETKKANKKGKKGTKGRRIDSLKCAVTENIHTPLMEGFRFCTEFSFILCFYNFNF